MELKTADFAKALNIARIVIEGRNTIPILSHVKATTDRPGLCRLQGTNLDQMMTVDAPIASGDTFFACLPDPAALAKLVRASGSDDMTIDHDNGEARIKAGELVGSVQSLAADDFPIMATAFNSPFEAELGADALDMIDRVSGAMSDEETRYYLGGVFFHHVRGWTYRAVATDGHRLYMGTIELPAAKDAHFVGKGKDAGVIIPRHAIQQLRRLRSFARKDAPVRFAVGRNNGNGAPSLSEPGTQPAFARFAIGCHGFPAELMTKTIDGTFPDYMRVVPDYGALEPQVVFRRADLRRALDGITAGMKERTRAVKLTFDRDGKLIVSAKWLDAGFDGKIAIPAQTRTKANGFEVGFNGGYLRAMLDASRGEELVLTTADASSPCHLVDPTATDFLAVLMPMRV